MRIDHESSHTNQPGEHKGGDNAESQRRLSVAEARAESLERECAMLQQSLTDMNDELERSKNTEQACKRLIEDKNQWLARLAHDLRGPLGGIRGMARPDAQVNCHRSAEESTRGRWVNVR